MARKKVARTLPALRGRRVFNDAERKTDRLCRILRNAARKYRSKEPKTFYCLRDVAARFQVPVSMVSAAYQQLEKEGLLTRVRGSRTVLEAVTPVRHVTFHEIIGVPMPLSSFLTQQKCRTFFLRTCRELRRRACGASGILFEGAEAKADFLLERIKHSEVTVVLWYMPGRCAREMAFLLKDAGVRVIGIGDGGVPAISCRYEVRREKALITILRSWKVKAGIKKITIVRTSRRSAVDEERLEQWIDSEELPYDFATIENETAHSFLSSLTKRKQQGIILPGLAASFFAFRAPESLCDLLRKHRVAFVDGPVSMPFASVPAVRADVVAADWSSIAAIITEDLLTRDAFSDAKATVFEAKAYLQAPLSEFAQPL
jgi:DNA-binding IscR family transcriptional regulator